MADQDKQPKKADAGQKKAGDNRASDTAKPSVAADAAGTTDPVTPGQDGNDKVEPKAGDKPQTMARIEPQKAALDKTSPKAGGPDGPAAPPPLPPRRWKAGAPLFIGFFALFVLVGGLGYWATMTELAGAVIAPGRIEVDRNRQVVQHPDGGVVAEVLVDEGDVVTIGQPLIRLDPLDLNSQRLVLESQLFELMARRGRFEAERDGSPTITFAPELVSESAKRPDVNDLMLGQARLYEARRDSMVKETEQLGKRRGQINNQIDGIVAQSTALETQLQLIGKELVSQQELLDKGLAQAARVLGLQREEARLAGQVGELTARKAQAEGLITEIEIEILKIQTLRREEAISQLRDMQYRELELLEQRRTIVERLSRLEIRAPVSGIVYGLRVFTPRSVIRGAEPVLFLVPQDRPLVIAAQVDPIHIDKIFVGQTVNLHFSAFDQRETPEITGHVVQISADAFQDEATFRNYYRAEIVLDEGEREKLPKDAKLIPGMQVESFIRTEDRTPLAYLLRPFTVYFAKAFRES